MSRVEDLVWLWRKLADEVLKDEGLRIGYRRCADELARELAADSPAQQVRDAMSVREGVILCTLLASLETTVRRILAAPTARHAHGQLERLHASVLDMIESFEALDAPQRREVDAEWTDLASLGGFEITSRHVQNEASTRDRRLPRFT